MHFDFSKLSVMFIFLSQNEISTGAIVGGIFVILVFTIIVLGGSQRLKSKSASGGGGGAGEDGGTEGVAGDVDGASSGDAGGIPGGVGDVGPHSVVGDAGGIPGGVGDVGGVGNDGFEECTTQPPTETSSVTLPVSTPSVSPQSCVRRFLKLCDLGSVYTKRQCQRCDNFVMMLAILFSLKTVESLQNGVATIF